MPEAVLNVVRRRGRPPGPGKPRGFSKKTWQARQIIENLELELGHSLDPIEGLARIAADARNPLDIRVDCWKTLAQFLYPKLGAVQISGKNGGPVEVRKDVAQVIMADPRLVQAALALAAAHRSGQIASSPLGEPLPPAPLPPDCHAGPPQEQAQGDRDETA